MNKEQKNEFIKTLSENIKEYYKNACAAQERKEYNTAVTLLFKALSSLCDLYIVVYENYFPTNHSERFRILEKKYPNIYEIIDKDFPFYQDSYRIKLNNEICEVFHKDVKELLKLLNLKI